jgi:septum site-determining protein MinC
MSEPHAEPSSPLLAAATGAPLRSPARPAAEFKGLSHPALRLVLNEAEPDVLAAALDTLLGVDDDEAFEWQPVVVDASRIGEEAGLALEPIVERLRDARLHPVAVAGAHLALRDEADRLRLGWLAPLPTARRTRPGADAKVTSDAGPVSAAPADVEPGAATGAPAGASASGPPAAATAAGPGAAPAGAGPAAAASGSTASAAGAAAGAPGATPPAATGAPAADAHATVAESPPQPAADAPPPALVVERPVRSGQQVYARGRDLIVVGDVSPGAEVIADGNVHVYGTLGGRAIAGARGRRDAGIFTLDLRAELVAVCGIYRTFEDGPPAAQAGKPVRISLEADADTLSMRTL